MFCSKCGVENPEGTKFCTACGMPLGDAAAPMKGDFGEPVTRQFVLGMTPTLGMFIAAALGILLVGLGIGTEEGGVTFAGTLILVLALLWGGLFLERQRLPVRVTLLVIGGLLILSIFVPAMAMPW